MSCDVYIAGGAHTRFGAHVQRDRETGVRTDTHPVQQMFAEVVAGALADANVEAGQADGIFVGSCSPGAFIQQELLAPLALQSESGLRFASLSQSTAACASGSVALFAAADAIQAGRAQVALVIGIEKMNLLDTPAVSDILARCSYWPEEGGQGMTFPGLFAQLGDNYRLQHGIGAARYREMLAAVSAANYRNGIHNPLAHFGPGSIPDKKKLLSTQAILELPAEKNPVIAPPLHLHDCSPISDGAAALVLVAKPGQARKGRNEVMIAGRHTATEFLPIAARPKNYTLEGAQYAAAAACREAGISVADLDLAEVHDCFTSNQLLCVEALGLSDQGCAGEDYLAGAYGESSKCKVNLSGGLKSKGHPVGATGVSMHYFAWRQLAGDAVGVAHPRNPEHAAVLNLGGSGVVNCASVLRAVR
ncbi:thiolase C-terminal domain-containing protein [Biformimicrobium ophioploci]|uniref:Acetyl-CoA acetyltransferase n=1 Tax=Biformimicrobium ophioploci TaxID=3036711 RepID=A0ABQ6LZQ4_9GAMM|nr:hypothetical protein [Microbulbifer sp. NKW57]GMG87557.1 acetyl-CoA acetyltransferase [Microbulbifer sp. NKW57]